MELHNIAELDSTVAYPGPLVRRIPRVVAEQLANGAASAEDASLCEIRFVVESGRRLAFSLTSLGGGEFFVYRGDIVQNHVRLPAGTLQRHFLDFENDAFAPLRPEAFARRTFSPRVWRVVLDGPTLFHGIDAMGCVLRAPLAEEKPRHRWLAYGSSITHGFTPVSRPQCYVAQTARLLGVDALNLGLSGACFLEPAFADYLAARDDWDVITCELGINVRTSMEPAEFARRVRHLVTAVTERQPGKPLVLISPFLTGNDLRLEPDLAATNTRQYEEILRALAAEHAAKTVHFLAGTDLLPDIAGLTGDLVHPSTEGHTTIAQNLAPRLGALLPSV